MNSPDQFAHLPSIVGMAWYRKEDWKKLRKIFADSNVLPATYNQWLQQAETGFRKLEGSGRTVEKVYIDPATFPAWCRERGLNVDANARMAFASEAVYRLHSNQG